MFFALIVGTIAGCYFGYRQSKEHYGVRGLLFAVSIFVAVIISFSGSAFIGGIFGDDQPRPDADWVDQYDIQLLAIADGTLTEGRIRGGLFVTTGYISERPVYLYYQQDSNGGIRQKNVSVNRATIYEDSLDGTAYITVRHIEYLEEWDRDFFYHDGAWWSNWYSPFWNLNGTEKDWDVGRVWYDIHLPPGSVVRDFVLDLN